MPHRPSLVLVPDPPKDDAKLEDVVKWAQNLQRSMVKTFRDREDIGGQVYAVSNLTADRTYDAAAALLQEVRDVLGTLISDLRDRGIVS